MKLQRISSVLCILKDCYGSKQHINNSSQGLSPASRNGCSRFLAPPVASISSSSEMFSVSVMIHFLCFRPMAIYMYIYIYICLYIYIERERDRDIMYIYIYIYIYIISFHRHVFRPVPFWAGGVGRAPPHRWGAPPHHLSTYLFIQYIYIYTYIIYYYINILYIYIYYMHKTYIYIYVYYMTVISASPSLGSTSPSCILLLSFVFFKFIVFSFFILFDPEGLPYKFLVIAPEVDR